MVNNIEWTSLRACIMVEQKNICAMCGKVLKDNEFTLHHIKSRAKKGKDILGNLIGLCNRCHDIAEDQQLNREEIGNYWKGHNIKKTIRRVHTDKIEQLEYDYPQMIILKEKFTLPLITERPNKYVLKYGKSITEIASIFGVGNSTVTEWDKDKEKSTWLKKRLEELKGGL